MKIGKIRMGQEEIFETIVKDQDGRQLDRWVCMKKDYARVARILNDKYGLQLQIRESRSDDLSWAK